MHHLTDPDEHILVWIGQETHIFIIITNYIKLNNV